MSEQLSPMEFWQEAEALGRAALISLEYFGAMGLAALDIDIPSPAAKPRNPAAAPKKTKSGEAPRPAAWAANISDPALLAEKTAACQACILNREGRENPLPGRGAASPIIAFVAASPAVFEGEAAKLLKAMIENALKLGPDEFYVTSLLKCPLKAETDFPGKAAEECFPIVRRELELLRPPIILALGREAGGFLGGRPGEHLLMLRKKTHTLDGLKCWLRVTYSLDDLLGSPQLKKEAWGDLQRIIPVLKKIRETA